MIFLLKMKKKMNDSFAFTEQKLQKKPEFITVDAPDLGTLFNFKAQLKICRD